MKEDQTTLVMAGAREAHGVIAGLLGRGRRVIASLPEPERVFEPIPVPTRIGGFEQADDMCAWLQQNGVGCVIDVSHAFDAEVSDMAAQVSGAQKVRYMRLLRPSWRATRQDGWEFYDTISAAARDVPQAARVFSNTGRASLPAFADFSGQALFLRQTGPSQHPPPYPFVKYIVGTPPFSQKSEEILFQELRISRLICRNVGGAASRSKLLAARRLGIRVSMIERPPAPEGMPQVSTVAEALAWEANP
ncbi:Precorrin-6A reductase [Roseobacter fucihabitans]|uniref:Precorrin-6A reductase n=1 Tax=Roseobacter fucihabitans TaxID=1537242 RepID=A0ABZ2BS09_9RHOB|nr:precorrin-6A/cobalt-precorrin-6A reductase [Roseobacter litoralis]MBC6968142.1 Precorrin-6A reductase [Roseobacter litoralis]